MSNLQQRVLSAIVLVITVLMLTWLGGVYFRLLAAAIGAAVLFEWFSMSGVWPDKPLAGLFAGAYGICAVMMVAGIGTETVLWVFLAMAVVGAVVSFIRGWTYWAVSGFAYAGLSAIALAGLRGDGAGGLAIIIFLFAVVWATDIFAYFVGRSFGGPKLAPSISPGKTWSGAIGGTIFAVAAGVAVAGYFGISTAIIVAFVGLLLSAISQIGDLFESWIKRRFGRKDSSNLIPGHGGVMDRVDGLVAAAMMLYLMAAATGFGS